MLLREHGGDGGATAVLVRCHGGHGGVAATPLRIDPTPGGTAEVMNIFKVSAVPPRRSTVLTVFGGATVINDGTTAETRRSWRCHCGLCRTCTAVAPRLRCDGGSTAEAPRRSAVLTVFRGATAINDGNTAEPRRPWRCHCGLCRTSTAVAPGIRCDGDILDLHNLHIILGQESKIGPVNQSSEIFPQNYTSFRMDRKVGGGGVFVLEKR